MKTRTILKMYETIKNKILENEEITTSTKRTLTNANSVKEFVQKMRTIQEHHTPLTPEEWTTFMSMNYKMKETLLILLNKCQKIENNGEKT